MLITAFLFILASCGRAPEASVVGIVPDAREVEISIAVCGDVMAHMPQLNSAQQADGSYDFNSNYDSVRDIMSSADLCMANIECTFPGGDSFMGYPVFKTPDSLAEALVNAGVDVGIFANNHMNDSGLDGALRTAEVIEASGMHCVGCRTDLNRNRSIVVPVQKDGEIINIGVVAYTYETSSSDSSRTMNGGLMSEEAPDYYNSFRQYADYYYLDIDIEQIRKEILWCKQRADITIVYLHWGEEYQRHSNLRQQYIASEIAKADPDAIIASHPHVIEEISYIDDIPVYYSIGNYISNQRYETLDNRYTEQGLIAMLEFTLVNNPVDDGKYVVKGDDFGPGSEVLGTKAELFAEEEYNGKFFKIFSEPPVKEAMLWEGWSGWNKSDLEAKAVPTWVNKFIDNGKTQYEIVPLIDGYEENEGLKLAGCVFRAEEALNDIKDLLGEEYIWNLK